MALLAAINPAELNVKVIGAEQAKEGHWSTSCSSSRLASRPDATPRLRTRRRYNDRDCTRASSIWSADFGAEDALHDRSGRPRADVPARQVPQAAAGPGGKGRRGAIALMFLDLPRAARVTGALAQLSDGEMMSPERTAEGTGPNA